MSIYEDQLLESDRSWMSFGLCLGATDLFFAERGESMAEAKKVCSQCPVKAECLQYAMDLNIKHGVWGGVSERQRRQKRRLTRGVEPQEGRRPVLQECGTHAGYQRHLYNGETCCDPCRYARSRYMAQFRAGLAARPLPATPDNGLI